MIRAAILTTSRADWNALGMVAAAMRADGGFDAHVLMVDSVMGRAVRDEGFEPSIIYSGTASPQHERAGAITESVGRMLWTQRRGLAVILGDRWDALAAAIGASMAGAPIAHLSGGDTTLGSLDDKYRDAITALATWHFPTYNGALSRLINGLSVPGARAWNVGSPAIDRIKATSLLPAGQVFQEIGLGNCERYCVLNWQPETAAKDPNAGLGAILGALESYTGGIVAVGQNDDVGSPEATALITAWAKPRTNVSILPNMRPQLYLSALANADFLIGNSSSGIYEAPALDCAVFNVGDRQRGRPLSENIINAGVGEIARAVKDFDMLRSFVVATHPFGDGNAAHRIVEILKSVLVRE